MRSGSIVIIGSATIDTIVQDAGTFHKIGGVATYGGITFRRHGLDATVLSNIAATDTAIFDLYRNYKIRLFNGLTPTTTRFVNHRGRDNNLQPYQNLFIPFLTIKLIAVLGSSMLFKLIGTISKIITVKSVL